MSMQEVDAAIRRLQMDDENIQAPAFCRRSVVEMMKTATRQDITPPLTQKEIVVWSEPSIGKYVHYAFRVTTGEETIIYNPVQTPGFPQYNGVVDSAPGFVTGNGSYRASYLIF